MLDCILLCGRLGKWISPETLLGVKEKERPLIDHQLYFLERFENVDKIIIAMHDYNSESIKKYLARRDNRKPIKLSTEEIPLGTGGAIKRALKLVTLDLVLVYNYNQLLAVNLPSLEKDGREKNSSIMYSSPVYKSDYGHHKVVDGWVEDFKYKPIKQEFTSCGWYLFKTEELRGILEKLPEEFSLEEEVFAKNLIRLKCGDILENFGQVWHPIESREDVERLEEMLRRRG